MMGESSGGMSPGADDPEEGLIGLLDVSFGHGNTAGGRSGADDLVQPGGHGDECVRPSGAIEENGRVTVLWTAVVSGAAADAFRSLIDPGGQHHFDEWHPGGGGEPVQGVHEVDPPEELADEHIVAGLEMGSGHGPSKVPCRQPRYRRLLERTTEHRPDDVDVESQGERVIVEVPASEGRLAAAGQPVEEHQPGHIGTVSEPPTTHRVPYHG